MPTTQTNSPLTDAQAEAVAQLLNTRNQLTIRYTRERVLKEATDYIVRLADGGDVIGCIQVKKVQWYQAEALHLTVAEAHERKGHAKALLCEAERTARAKDARLLQCTIRTDNNPSCSLFEGFGFMHVSTFHNTGSGKNVGVFQKVLANAC